MSFFRTHVTALAFALLFALSYPSAQALIPEKTAKETRGRIHQALLSPSGKLTYIPELVIPDPSDPTAILLQTNAVQTLSSRIRRSRANAAFVQGPVNSIRTLVQEQELARGSFPGPVPIIYCANSESTTTKDDVQDALDSGSDGIKLCVAPGNIDNIAAIAQHALELGIQPIPEIQLDEATVAASEFNVESILTKVANAIGQEPVSVLLTIIPTEIDDSESEHTPIVLPTIPKALGKLLPILGSVRVAPGENRLSNEAKRFQQCGFTGVVLGADCVPRIQAHNLAFVTQFWAACLDDLKSTKSKNYSFRSKNNMNTNVATQWANYQNSVVESGALGDPNESVSILDEGAGDYKGF
jgi:hypothetical protein